MSDPQDWNAKTIAEFRANEGKVGGNFEGAPMVLLHHRGRKSGHEYVTPTMYLPHDTEPGSIYVFATKAGAPTGVIREPGPAPVRRELRGRKAPCGDYGPTAFFALASGHGHLVDNPDVNSIVTFFIAPGDAAAAGVRRSGAAHGPETVELGNFDPVGMLNDWGRPSWHATRAS